MQLIICLKRLSKLILLLTYLFINPLPGWNQPNEPIKSLKEVNLEQCLSWAEEHFLLNQRKSRLAEIQEMQQQNASKQLLPQFSIQGQAQYQSAVTEIPIEIPNLEVPAISQDQYRLFLDASLPLTERARVSSQKELITIQGEIDQQKVRLDWQQIQSKVEQLYFGIMIHDLHIEQLSLHLSDLDSTYHILNSAINLGEVSSIELSWVELEKIQLTNQYHAAQNTHRSLIEQLNQFTGKKLSAQTGFIEPVSITISETESIQRAELELLKLRDRSLTAQTLLSKIKVRPQLQLYAQSGLGRPALNLLSNDLEGYYLGGIRMQWNISSFYTQQNERKQIELQKELIQVEESTFLNNHAFSLQPLIAQKASITQQVESDQSLLSVHENIASVARNQLKNGLIDTIDYLAILTKQHQAKIQAQINRIQSIQIDYQIKNHYGN